MAVETKSIAMNSLWWKYESKCVMILLYYVMGTCVDTFDFTIVDFPHLSSSSTHTYTSTLIFSHTRLKSSFKKVYGRDHDIVDHYKSFVTSMMTNVFVN